LIDRWFQKQPAPSATEIHVTCKLREAAKILEIELLDHVIVGEAKADPLGRGTFERKPAFGEERIKHDSPVRLAVLTPMASSPRFA
jgi:hypothetical protein